MWRDGTNDKIWNEISNVIGKQSGKLGKDRSVG